MPEDDDARRRGLLGPDESALILFGRGFQEFGGPEPDRVPELVRRGEAPGDSWRTIRAARFLEDLLAEVVETYCGHPLAKEEIGYAGGRGRRS